MSNNICEIVRRMLMAAFAVVVFVGNVIGQSVVETWDCGETPGTVMCVLAADGTLTISGTGPMANFSRSGNGAAPWCAIATINNIINVIIEEGVTSVGAFAFFDCERLVSVTIPSTVTSIVGDDVFYFCWDLTAIAVNSDNVDYYSEDGVLFNKSQTILLRYPPDKKGAYIIPDGVVSINEKAFHQCEWLTSVTIPNSVTTIENIFSDCDGIMSINVTAGNVNYSSEDGVLFNNDKTVLIQVPYYKSSASYTVPGSVAIIKERAFYKTQIDSVTIPAGVDSIGEEAFAQSQYLTSISFLNPAPPRRVGEHAFTLFNNASPCFYITQGGYDDYLSEWKYLANCVRILDNVSVRSRAVSLASSFRMSVTASRNGASKIIYTLPSDAALSFSVYNLKGARIAFTPARPQLAGQHEFMFKASKGSYIIEVQTVEKFNVTKYVEKVFVK